MRTLSNIDLDWELVFYTCAEAHLKIMDLIYSIAAAKMELEALPTEVYGYREQRIVRFQRRKFELHVAYWTELIQMRREYLGNTIEGCWLKMIVLILNKFKWLFGLAGGGGGFPPYPFILRRGMYTAAILNF